MGQSELPVDRTFPIAAAVGAIQTALVCDQ
jgi:hypothetical protein